MNSLQICLICQVELDFNIDKELPCKCLICLDCIFDWLEAKIEGMSYLPKNIFTCPNSPCLTEISLDWVLRNLPTERVNIISEALLKIYLTSTEDIRKCPGQKCNYAGYWNMNETCYECFKCPVCFMTWRDKKINLEDKLMEIQNSLIQNAANFLNLIKHNYSLFIEEYTELKINMLYKPCYHCKKFVNKFAGCNHIKCSCQKEFCYFCLGNWENHIDKYCNHKHIYVSQMIFFMIVLFILKTIISSYYLRALWCYILYYIGCLILLCLNIFVNYFITTFWYVNIIKDYFDNKKLIQYIKYGNFLRFIKVVLTIGLGIYFYMYYYYFKTSPKFYNWVIASFNIIVFALVVLLALFIKRKFQKLRRNFS